MYCPPNPRTSSHDLGLFSGIRRPDGVAFDAKGKQCVSLEFNCPMDSVTSSDQGNWAERKEIEENERYGMHLYFINYLRALSRRPTHTYSSLSHTKGDGCMPCGRICQGRAMVPTPVVHATCLPALALAHSRRAL